MGLFCNKDCQKRKNEESQAKLKEASALQAMAQAKILESQTQTKSGSTIGMIAGIFGIIAVVAIIIIIVARRKSK